MVNCGFITWNFWCVSASETEWNRLRASSGRYVNKFWGGTLIVGIRGRSTLNTIEVHSCGKSTKHSDRRGTGIQLCTYFSAAEHSAHHKRIYKTTVWKTLWPNIPPTKNVGPELSGIRDKTGSTPTSRYQLTFSFFPQNKNDGRTNERGAAACRHFTPPSPNPGIKGPMSYLDRQGSIIYF